MAARKIAYRCGYKYQLATPYAVKISIRPKEDIDTEFIKLKKTGNLTVARGYAWDGPSGPVIDTKQNMRASLVHDALYQLMRNEKLRSNQKAKADTLFKRMCIEDGVPAATARIYHFGLRIGGKPATDPKNKKKIKRAP